MQQQISSIKLITLVFCILVVCFTVVSSSFAWQTPGNTPPNINVAAPLNVSSTSQYKSGNLGIGTNPGGTFPSTTLDVNGQIRVRGGTPAAGSALLSTDTTGLASWGSCPVGTAGAAGAQGPVGLQGAMGAQGPQGPTGPQGLPSAHVCVYGDNEYGIYATCRVSCTPKWNNCATYGTLEITETCGTSSWALDLYSVLHPGCVSCSFPPC